MTGASDTSLRMLTFAPTIDSETARLALRWYGVSFVEEDHLFGWVSLLTLRHGGYGVLPLVYDDRLSLNGSRRLIAHFDPLARHARRLIPDDLATEADADWAAYNVALGHEVAVFAYFHLLAAPELMIPVFAEPVPPGEARLTPKVYPALRWLFTTLLQLKPERAQVAATRIRDIFAATDRRLGNGRRFLQGDRLTLGDVAFAGAAAPLLQPPGFGARLPDIATMPVVLRETVAELRRHATADYVDRVYGAMP